MALKRLLYCLSALVLAALPVVAQEGHGITPADIQRGLLVYSSSCINCHGPDGDQISGVSLASGRFRRAQSDNDLVQIIQKGIPGTAMPPGAYTDDQANVLVGYIRSMASSTKSTRKGPPGDVSRGKAVVETKGQCLNCHRIGSQGTVAGPDLTAIGGTRRLAEIETSLLDPSAEIRPENRPVRAVGKDGTKISGTLMNQDTYTIQILDSKGKLRSLYKSNLREYEFLKTSPMPNFKDKLSEQELSDVISYLVTLKGLR